eukprot:TRINITY_DN83_c0_g1_i1.p2 TRINITY_DN83_c0_g1~~TRINITY_DN83_c0_g1_i1.p2  ORF type:complete len:217 (+),score=87.21 TRINITY_DN83_c0_g1_i1:106-756(+)
MSFGDLSKPEALNNLNKHLDDKSYVGGYTPSQQDVTTFAALTAEPAAKYTNVLRWWNHVSSFSEQERAAFPAGGASAAAAAKPASKDEDDIDLFGDDDDDEEHQKEISRIAAEAAARKNASGKKKEALKSAVVVDVKPWDDTTDMAALEKKIREEVVIDGLEWKASKLTAIGYGIKKLQISCHIEDEKVSVDDIQEKIQEMEDYVQSTDIDSFTKL